MNAALVRKLALALPEAYEDSHFDVADFRVKKKIFATIHPGGKTGVLLRLDPDLCAQLADRDPDAFERVGAGGRALKIVFARVERGEYEHLVRQAWEAIAPKKRAPPSKRRG
ncbi:MAG TPA: MmcQ/YjbR family DNA-binding protein [Kofleriaceae bacterium]|jgi:hypothetical protein|nr:MmcQ/YjbR family DNA-binding protein [Kofleriaceae bacterium]